MEDDATLQCRPTRPMPKDFEGTAMYYGLGVGDAFVSALDMVVLEGPIYH